MKRDECPVPCEDCFDYETCATRATLSGVRLVAGALVAVVACLVAVGVLLLALR